MNYVFYIYAITCTADVVYIYCNIIYVCNYIHIYVYVCIYIHMVIWHDVNFGYLMSNLVIFITKGIVWR